THHRGLGGATFGIFALASGLVLAIAVARIVGPLVSAPPDVQRVVLGVAVLTSFVALVVVGLRTARGGEPSSSAVLVVLLAITVAASIASTRSLRSARVFAIIGPPLAAAVLLFGIATLRSEPPRDDALEKGAPVHAWLLDLVSPGAP